MNTGQSSLGMRHFGTLDLGDARRTACLIRSVDIMCRHPGGTLPDKLNRPADLRAFYRLMQRPEVTHEILLRSHAEHTRSCIAALGQGVVLILHDATELDYTTKTTLREQLGQIGQGTHRGYSCHNSLAVRADSGAVLGLTSPMQRRERHSRESRLWVHGVQASGPAPAGVLCVDVSDRLSDTCEYLAYEVTQGRSFVLRQREDRRLETPVAGQQYLEAALRALPSQGQRQIRVLVSPRRRARRTTVYVAFTPVRLSVPGKQHGEYAKIPLDLWAVRVWEPDTPANEEPLEWMLLTNVPVHQLADAQERIDGYEKRPIMEEYHKGRKTGCRIESMPFDKIERLEPAIAVVSVVTTTLLQLRDAARAPDADQRLATEVMGADYVEVPVNHYGNRLGPRPTILQFYLHVARLGGHQNRKVDGFPGWITLWRGWARLQAMVDGHHARHPKNKVKCGRN